MMPELPRLVTGPWTLAQLSAGEVGAPKHGLRVFSCFHCGGGSTMGYKLAGFDVIGGVEIDPEMMAIYRKNHSPMHSYLEGVQTFKNRNDLPEELFDLDVLDGSPPCSSFSMAGSREDAWGDKKKFREGQAEQVLDDLFFDFIDIAKRLQPRVVIAENVKGLIIGNARGYVKMIFDRFRGAGYETQLFLFNSSRMGVPQARERTFFVARRSSLNMEKISPVFDEPVISALTAFIGTSDHGAKPASEKAAKYWSRTKAGGLFSVCGASTGKMNRRLDPKRPAWTQTATKNLFHWERARYLSPSEAVRIQSFPDDFDFAGHDAGYVCGMSVPPLMMQRVATEVARTLLSASPR